MENDNKQSGTMGFAGLLFLVFLVLKLTKVINWSWWWITAPLWIPAVIVLLIGIGVLFWICYKSIQHKRRTK